MDPPPSRKPSWAALAIVFVASVALYAGSLDLGFFSLDDRDYVEKNVWIRSLSWENVRHILTEPFFANYSPLHLLSYALDYRIAGASPLVFHLSSCLWGAGVACLVYLLALRLASSSALALLAALLFVAHPAHVEAIAWISSRKDLVAAFFGVAATIAYLRYRERPSGLRYAWTLILFALAVAGKMSVVVLPAIWVALDLFREHRRGPMLWCDKIPHAAIAVAMALPVFGAQPPSRYHPDLSVIGHTFANNLWLLTGFGTHVVYRAQADPDVSAAIKLLYALPVIAALVVPLLLRRVLPGVVIALLYALWLALLPPQVLSFVHPICDRYLFFPSVFSIILIAIGIAALARGRSTLLWLAGGVLVLAWGARTVAYLSEWRDPRSLWFAATTKSQDPNVFQYLGSHYQDAGDRIARYRGGDTLDVASESGLATLVWRDDPRLPALLAEWRQGNRSGLSAEYQRQLADLAWAQFERAVELGSGWLRPKLYLRRGKVQAERGNLEAALVELRKALELSELHPYEADSLECGVRALFGLGMASLGLGRTEQALDYLARAESEQRRGGVMFEPRIASVKAQIEAQLGGKR